MAQDSVRNTFHGWKATLYALRLSQLKWVGERVAEVRHVRVGGGVGRKSMGLTPWEQLWVMLAAVAFFHTSEFLLALAFHGRRRVNAASTLISGPYLVALVLSMVEHALESRFAPGLKGQAFVSYAGLAMVVLGEGLRKLAVVTANKSFTHDIKVDKRQEHKLVTHGIYRFFRHPSYLGFFIWSIGTQVLLVNPVCIVGYTVVTWRFFENRIPYEEYFLCRFFGQDYVDYANRVPSGMPFIK